MMKMLRLTIFPLLALNAAEDSKAMTAEDMELNAAEGQIDAVFETNRLEEPEMKETIKNTIRRYVKGQTDKTKMLTELEMEFTKAVPNMGLVKGLSPDKILKVQMRVKNAVDDGIQELNNKSSTRRILRGASTVGPRRALCELFCIVFISTVIGSALTALTVYVGETFGDNREHAETLALEAANACNFNATGKKIVMDDKYMLAEDCVEKLDGKNNLKQGEYCTVKCNKNVHYLGTAGKVTCGENKNLVTDLPKCELPWYKPRFAHHIGA